MTQETCKQGLQVERLDYSRPPPGFELRETSYEDGYTDCAATRDICLADAWLRFKEENDPPGLQTWEGHDDAYWRFGVEREGVSRPGAFGEQSEARAAAWAWHDRRHALAARLDAEAVVLVEHLGGGRLRRVPTQRGRVAEALLPMLTMADPDDDWREETVEAAERLFSEGRLTFEGDPPIGLESLAAWPAALTWSDEQVAAVERWLPAGGELPEVLRA